MLDVNFSWDIPIVRKMSLAPPPDKAPPCFRCGEPSVRFITRRSNRNGNVGRPYYKCVECRQFLVFADERGNDPQNPPCDCGTSSKTQVSGPDKSVPRGVHYVCRLGKCDFYAPCMDQEGNQVALVGDQLLDQLAALRII